MIGGNEKIETLKPLTEDVKLKKKTSTEAYLLQQPRFLGLWPAHSDLNAAEIIMDLLKNFNFLLHALLRENVLLTNCYLTTHALAMPVRVI